MDLAVPSTSAAQTKFKPKGDAVGTHDAAGNPATGEAATQVIDTSSGGRRSSRSSKRGGKRSSRRGGSRASKRGGKRGGKRSSRRGGSRASRR